MMTFLFSHMRKIGVVEFFGMHPITLFFSPCNIWPLRSFTERERPAVGCHVHDCPLNVQWVQISELGLTKIHIDITTGHAQVR